MTAIDDRAAQLAEQGKDLGPALDVERKGPGTWRHRAYQNATLVQIPNAGVYIWPEGTVGNKFLDAPGE